jgi:hypothetical protein
MHLRLTKALSPKLHNSRDQYVPLKISGFRIVCASAISLQLQLTRSSESHYKKVCIQDRQPYLYKAVDSREGSAAQVKSVDVALESSK